MKRIIQIQADVDLIDSLIEASDEKTASKAFLSVAESYLAYLEAGDAKNRQIQLLQKELSVLKSENRKLLSIISSIENAYSKIQEVLCLKS